jgi:tRNA A-37 threonylcarbamoyl transferase component Bud32
MNQVGKGGMATVYKAYQAAMDRYVAIKVLPSRLAETSEFMGRFQQEARIIANLEHPHILPVFDYGESDGISYLVMRYLEAGTLKDKMNAGPLPLAEIDRLFSQLADALGYAHGNGVIHRDLKPSNVLVDSQGNVFLTDFGIAKLLEGSVKFTQTDAIIGTPDYISPEQAQGQPADQRSDIYSLGIILYEMLTGRVPFTADTPMAVILKHVSAPLPLPSSVKADVSPAIERVILRALSKNPKDRFATAAEFVSAWKRALAESDRARRPAADSYQATTRASPVAPGAQAVQPAAAPSKRLPAGIIIGCLVGACLLLAVGGIAIAALNWGSFRLLASQTATASDTPAADAASPGDTATEDQSGEAPAASSVDELQGDRFDIAIGDEIAKDSPGQGAGFIENPGAKDIYDFTADDGQTVYFQIKQLPETNDLINWRLVDEIGNDLFNSCLQCGDPGDMTFDQAGTYTIIIGDDGDAGSGVYGIQLWEVPEADEFTIEIGDEISQDSPEGGAGFIETPGVKDKYTFSAEPGQTVYFQVQQLPQSSELIDWYLVDEYGTDIFYTCLQCGDPGVKTLEQGGMYFLVVGNDNNPATGSYGIKLWDVPPSDAFEIDIGDLIQEDDPGPGAGSIESPGAKDEYTFTAEAGETVYFHIVQPPQTSELITWRLIDDTGNEIFNTCLQCGDPGEFTLDLGGTYTILVGNDTGAAVGTYQIKIYTP